MSKQPRRQAYCCSYTYNNTNTRQQRIIRISVSRRPDVYYIIRVQKKKKICIIIRIIIV